MEESSVEKITQETAQNSEGKNDDLPESNEAKVQGQESKEKEENDEENSEKKEGKTLDSNVGLDVGDIKSGEKEEESNTGKLTTAPKNEGEEDNTVENTISNEINVDKNTDNINDLNINNIDNSDNLKDLNYNSLKQESTINNIDNYNSTKTDSAQKRAPKITDSITNSSEILAANQQKSNNIITMSQSQNMKPSFTLTQENIMFPTFGDEDFENQLTERMDQDTLLRDMQTLQRILQEVIAMYADIIINNKNDFNNVLSKYKRRSFDSYLILKTIDILVSVIKIKLTHDKADINLELSDLLLKNQQFKQLISFQYTKPDQDALTSLLQIDSENFKIIKNDSHPLGIIVLNTLVKYLTSTLDKIKAKIIAFLSITNWAKAQNDEKRANFVVLFDLVQLLRRMEVANLMLFNAYFLDKKDIFNCDEDSEEWKRVKKGLFRVVSGNMEGVKSTLNFQTSNLLLNQAIILKGIKENSSTFMNLTRTISLSMKYKAKKNLIEFESKESQLKSSKSLMREFLELTTKPIFSKISPDTKPKIALKKVFWAKREHLPISVPFILKLIGAIYGEAKAEEIRRGESSEIFKVFLPDREKVKAMEMMKLSNPKESSIFYVKTILIHNKPLKIKGVSEGGKFLGFFGKKKVPEYDHPEAVLIHIHGGGFIATDTEFHESYLRNWAIQLGIPLIGIDYHLSPQSQYPTSLDDCFQSYTWLISHAEEYLGFSPKKVILSGDSSGGNLALGLTSLIIAINKVEKQSIKVPDLVITQYPCCNTSLRNMSLSMCLCLQDQLLNFWDLKYMNISYRGSYRNDMDPFLNPTMANEFLLKNFPKIRFLIASEDPLRDDAIRLVSNLTKVGKDVKCYEFKGYFHAFMGNESEIIRGNPTDILFREIREVLEGN